MRAIEIGAAQSASVGPISTMKALMHFSGMNRVFRRVKSGPPTAHHGPSDMSRQDELASQDRRLCLNVISESFLPNQLPRLVIDLKRIGMSLLGGGRRRGQRSLICSACNIGRNLSPAMNSILIRGNAALRSRLLPQPLVARSGA